MVNKTEISLYIHVPFCTRKCDYCHFFVLPNKPFLQQQFIESLEKEFEARKSLLQGKEIVSIYFGGGTPALIGAAAVQQILNWVQKSPASISSDAEITLEANPENVSLALMKDFQAAGINRVSIGVQTLNNTLLKALGRTHGATQALESVQATFQAGIENISIDLMYDLPGQTLDAWEHTLAEAAALPISHLSLYNLTIEPHTVFFKQLNKLKPLLPDEDTSLRMYQRAINFLEYSGLCQYEISAFARHGRISRHNIGYWTARPFLGLGPSAFSYWEGRRFRNICSLSKYAKLLSEGIIPVDFEEELSPDAKNKELLAIHLRLKEGVNLANFEAQHGPLSKETQTAIAKLNELGFITIKQNLLLLTSRGVLFYDTVAEELI